MTPEQLDRIKADLADRLSGLRLNTAQAISILEYLRDFIITRIYNDT